MSESDVGLDGGSFADTSFAADVSDTSDTSQPFDASDAADVFEEVSVDANPGDVADADLTDTADVADSSDVPDVVPVPGPAPGTIGVVAGSAATGFVDGEGIEARFSGPTGAALAPDGETLYVADTFNNTIRRANLGTGVVETIAGRVGVSAGADGVGAEASFQSPRAMAVSPDGATVYVADAGTIRALDTATLEVTTVAGVAGTTGYTDGVGADARMGYLQHAYVVSDDGAVLYIMDRSNARLRAMDTTTFAVTTLAGDKGDDLPPHRDGVGTEATFSSPGGLALYDGALFIADMGNNAIRKYDLATAEVTTLAGIPGTSGNEDGGPDVATFQIIQGVTAHDGHLYVVGFNNTLRQVSIETGAVETILGVYQESAALDGDADAARLGISFNSAILLPERGTDGALLYLDRDGSSFRAIDLETRAVGTVFGAKDPTGHRDGAAGQAMFNGPDSVVCNALGDTCYLSDTYNHVIRVLDRAGESVLTLAGEAGDAGDADGALEAARFAWPRGLALDEAAQVLYVADSGNYTIRTVDLADGVVATLAGSSVEEGSADGVASAARFSDVTDLALTSDGSTLYVTDYSNNTVRAVATDDGLTSTLIGVAGDAEHVDGDATSGRLSSPSGLALSADETRLYVSQRNAVVREITLGAAPAVTTIAGSPDATGVASGTFADALFDGLGDLLVSPLGRFVYVVEGRNGTVRRLDTEEETVSMWIGSETRAGNGPTGVFVPWDEATLYYGSGIARAGEDVVILAEDAVVVGRPEEATW